MSLEKPNLSDEKIIACLQQGALFCISYIIYSAVLNGNVRVLQNDGKAMFVKIFAADHFISIRLNIVQSGMIAGMKP